jgi:hypothetical protein
MYKSHTDAYDLLVDFSDSIPADTEDVRSRGAVPPPTPKLFETAPNSSGGKPTAVPITYAFVDLALYRSLVLLDQSPHSVHAETVGFSATSRTGGMWLVVFEMFERLWHLCVGLCEFTIGRGNVGAIALEDDEHAVLLRVEPADDDDTTTVPDTEADGESDSDAVGGARADVDIDLTEAIRRGRLILDQLHHNAHHLYARLLTTAAGSWELSDDSLRTLTGSSRLSWGGRTASDSRFWLALARTWNVEPTTETETAASASG